MAHNSGYTKLFVDRTDPNNPVGISLGEIRRCLYGPSGGEGVDLSRSPNIKKWAKFKPMPVGDVSGYTDAQAKLINYGLFVPYYTSLHSMFEDILDGNWTRATNYNQDKQFWTYDGLGANDTSRTLDFDGYLHNARELMSAITSAAYCNIDSDPAFVSHTENSTDGNLGPKDMRVIVNGAIAAQNMYYGLFLYNSIIGRQFRVIGEAASLTTGDKSFSDSRFTFPRLGDEQTIKAFLFLCDSNIGNGAVVENQDNFNGYFIPITTSLATLAITFERITAGLSGNPDPVIPWWGPDASGNVTFVFRSLPNRSYTWSGYVAGEYDNALGTQSAVETDFFSVNLPVREDNGVQLPVWIRIGTKIADDEATVKVYVTDTSKTFQDVADENNIGQPIETTTVSTSGDYNFGQMTRAALYLDSQDGQITEMCPIGTWPND